VSQKTQWIAGLLSAGVLLVGMATVGSAQSNGDNGWNNGDTRWKREKSHSAPELNPAAGATALSLLSGVILVIRGRRRS
jgi:hypothetical protein